MTKGKADIEDEYSAKLDMCLTDGIIKTGWFLSCFLEYLKNPGELEKCS